MIIRLIIKHIFFGVILISISCAGKRNDKKQEELKKSKPDHLPGDSSVLYNISYGEHASQKLDVYIPTKPNNKTIIYVHGGSWYAGDKTEAIHWAKYFQGLGYTFICMNYRLTNTTENNIHPAQINDIDSALHFLYRKAGEWQLNKDHFIIMGASAGGHLSTLYAYRYNNDRKIKLAISLCGILDLTDDNLLSADLGDMNGGTMITKYIGDTITNSLNGWINASPFSNITANSVPTFFIHGKKDEIVPYQQSHNAYVELRRLNIPTVLRLLENVDHDLLSIDLTTEFDKIDSFMRRYFDGKKSAK